MSRGLEQVQRDFAAMLLEPHSPRGRAQIYHHNRLANFRKALALEYPLIERIVGAEFFAQLALEFMTAHPSRSGDLHLIGEAFPAFLADGFAAHESSYAYLVDLAQLEWAWQRALIAADAPTIGTDALAAFAPADWPQLHFRLQPALRVIESRWPIHTLFLEHRREQPALVHLGAGGECAAVLRRGDVVEVHRLQTRDAALWKALANGQTLELAVAAALAQTGDGEFDLGSALGSLFALGVVARITGE